MVDRIYLTGATGKLGKVVFEKIDAIPLVRHPSGLKNEIVIDNHLKEKIADATAIIHLAGSIHGNFKESNIELTKKIVEAAPKNAKIILASSISVYGKKSDLINVDELSQINPDSPYSKSKAEAERIVSKCKNHVILRISPIYGKMFPDFLYVIKLIDKGKIAIIGDGKNNIPFVHVEDVALAIVNSIKKGNGIYIIAGTPLSQNEIYEVVSNLLKVPFPKKIPKIFAGLIFWLSEITSRINGKKPVLRKEHLEILLSNRTFNCKKATQEIGFKPRPLKEGILEIVKEYKH